MGVQVPLAAPKNVFYSCQQSKNFATIFSEKEMKGLNLFLAACFGATILNGAMADTVKNTGRTTLSSRNTNSPVRNANATKQRTNTASRTATTKNIIQRNNTNDRARTVSSRDTNAVARTASSKQNVLSRTATKTTSSRFSGLSRAATVQTRESVMQRDFGKCKSVFFECMDEFCANKDAQLKRCACSGRANEFKNTQKSLDNVEDKLLDFSQRLLTINMDPADAAVINTESEGERAYNETRDTTASKRALDEIAKKLNTKFDSAGRADMSALSWDLNIDSAFDSVDSLTGVSTTAKSGTALRNAALPICREMAAEVCTDDDISLVENSYNMTIEQDCNTVKKAYETQTQAARNKILESSALLDMTRLNNYQDNNSDDILTCKSKMLDMLTNTNVCGDDLTKCLDISGRYINPTTGEAFLSPDLIQLADLITRPTNTDTWAKTPKNASFVSYLNAKKKYIEPATKNCQDIADTVWNDFIEDALSQIKIAQDAKLEEVRQSCTSLLTDCIDNAKQDLSEFDSRALSTFGVISDKTVNALCENVRTSCAAIMEYTPDNAPLTADANWNPGVTEISAAETYNTIINTCREIGRDCIINSCKSITGNFGLCESINGSVNRHSILNRSACWSDVKSCIDQTSDASIIQIRGLINLDYTTFYTEMYGETSDYDICNTQCALITNSSTDTEKANCYRCRIAEQIWGNCKHQPDNMSDNAILIPSDPNKTTLLSWFATNTHTQDELNSCATSICPAGSIDMLIGTSTICVSPTDVVQCDNQNLLCRSPFITTPTNKTNCCETEYLDQWGNCCMGGVVSNIIEYTTGVADTAITTSSNICTKTSGISSMTLMTRYTDNGHTNYIFCAGTVGTVSNDPDAVSCSGQYIALECNGTNCYYKIPTGSNSSYDYSVNYFINVNKSDTANYCPVATNTDTTNKCSGTTWGNWNCSNTSNTNRHWMVGF